VGSAPCPPGRSGPSAILLGFLKPMPPTRSWGVLPSLPFAPDLSASLLVPPSSSLLTGLVSKLVMPVLTFRDTVRVHKAFKLYSMRAISVSHDIPSGILNRAAQRAFSCSLNSWVL